MKIQDIKDKTNTMNYFLLHTGGRIEKLERGHCEIVLTLGKQHQNYNEMVHGGVMLTLIDAAAGAAARTYGGRLVTLESKTNFIRGIHQEGQEIRAISDVVHNGRTIKLCETKVYDKGKVACTGTTTMFLTDPEPAIEE